MVAWTKQPPAGTQIDWSNSLTEGLVAAYVFDDAGFLRDVSGHGHHGTVSLGAPTIVMTPQGVAVHMNGDNFSIPAAADFQFDNEDQTICMGVSPQAAADGLEFIEMQSGAVNLWQIRSQTDSPSMFVKGASDIIEATSTTNWTNGQYYNVAGRVRFSDNFVSIWVDGINEAQTSIAASDGQYNTNTPVLIGGGNAGNINSYFHYLYIFRDAKSDRDIKALNENPWQIFKPKPRFALTDVPSDVRFSVIKQVRTKQPPAGTKIDWNNSIARKLVFAYVGTTDIDLVTGRSAVASPIKTISNLGTHYETNTSNPDFTFSFDNRYITGQAHTWLWIGRKNASISPAGINGILSHRVSGASANGDGGLYEDASDFLSFYQRTAASGQEVDASSLTLPASGVVRTAIAVDSTTSRRFYLQSGLGTLQSDTGTGTLATIDNAANVIRVNSIQETPTTRWDAEILVALKFNAALTRADINSLFENPWQIFEPELIHVPFNEELPALAMFEKGVTSMPARRPNE